MAHAQTTVDSLEHALARTTAPVERLKLMVRLSKADDPVIMATYGHGLVRFSDSLLAHGHAGETAVLSAKASGLWSIGRGYAWRGMPDSSLHWAEQAIPIWQAAGDGKMLAFGNSQLSQKFVTAGRASEALVLLAGALRYHVAVADTEFIVDDHSFMGRAYDVLGDFPQALDHYDEALRYSKGRHDMESRAWLLSNIGNIYLSQQRLDTALNCYELAAAAYARSTVPGSAGIALNNIALILNTRKKYTEALEYCDKGLAVATNNNEGRCVLLQTKASVYQGLGDLDNALRFGRMAVDALDGSTPVQNQLIVRYEYGLILSAKGRMNEALEQAVLSKALIERLEVNLERRMENAFLFSEIYAKTGQPEKALAYYREYTALKDSVRNEETDGKLRRMDLRKQELADSLRHEAESHRVALVHQQDLSDEQDRKNRFMYGGIALLVIAISLWGRLRYTRRAKQEVEKERDRSDALLLNILPEEIAEELKNTGGAAARDIEQVSILFTDFKGFTQLSEQLTAQELVAEIDTCFKAFDGLLAKHGIEKIKTIGDAYMAAGGLPSPAEHSTRNTVLAALEMQDFMRTYKTERVAQGKPAFEMRVGIHTGPVVAGIVGVKKFQYDIWGDTVNIASRMESSGEVGQVNISGSTYELVRSDAAFTFVPRGKVQAKGKGELEMFFVERQPI